MGTMKYTPARILRHLKWLFNKYQDEQRIKRLKLGLYGKHVQLMWPTVISNPSHVFLHDYTRIHRQSIIYNYTGKFIMKEYSAASIELLVVTGNHRSTVGVPHYMLGLSHINDKETDIIVEEDVWIGARVTLLAGTHIGRGAVIGASSLVNKEVPPYAVAVGSPVRIVASKFTLEQILEHEKALYPEEKRFTREYLEELFQTYYQGKKSIGLNSDLVECGFYEFMKRNNYNYIS